MVAVYEQHSAQTRTVCRLLKHFRAFIRNTDASYMRVPAVVQGAWGATIVNRREAQKLLHFLVDVAINRKAGIVVSQRAVERLQNIEHDLRVIEDYENRRIRATGCQNLLRDPRHKRLYPHIDHQPVID